MTIAQFIDDRSIQEVVHFTTNHGCLGTLYTKWLQSRTRLQGDEMVEYLFAPNASLRKDTAYLDHVSLSINHINHQFYGVSSGAWHSAEPIFWCILSFDPVIMTHPEVEFATTNNIYTSVRRGKGVAGIEPLYAPRVTRWHGNVVTRPVGLSNGLPTCFQAEVLYPSAISTEHLNKIYVKNAGDQSEIVGFLKATFHRDVDVVIAQNKFESRTV